MQIVVVILAGGASSRFGSDKLGPSTGLLDELLSGVSPDFVRILVGPPRSLPRHRGVHTVREDPPGGGPAAGLLTGLFQARALAPDAATMVLPGDTPGGGRLVMPLMAGLVDGVCAVCPAGDDGPLPLPVALSPEGRDRLLASGTDGRGQSVRRLLAPLRPSAIVLDPDALFDIDTRDDLLTWQRTRAGSPGSQTQPDGEVGQREA